MIHATIYSKTDGRILRTVSVTRSALHLNISIEEGYLLGSYQDDIYFVDLEIASPVLRKENPTTLDGATLHNVPHDSIVAVDSKKYPASGTVELDFTPGTYRIRIDSPVQYKPKELTVEINP